MPRNIYGPEHEDFRASVKEFVERTLKPRAEQMLEVKTIDRDIWKEAGSQGLFGLGIPEEFGGMGADDYRFNAVAAEVINGFNAETLWLGSIVSVLSFTLMIGISALELLVAGIQAYVFALLTSLYINDAVNLH